jgi:integrase
MQAKPARVPSYRLHKGRGKNLAAVTINGKPVYLGPHGSAESLEKYHQEIAQWHAARSGRIIEPPPSASGDAFLGINNLVEAYLNFAEKHYVKETGEQTPEFDCIVSAVEPVTDVYGLSNSHEFGPKKLKLVREHMIGLKWTRGTINKAISRIKRMFKWAVAEELVSPTISHGLQALQGLRGGRSRAKETERVKPVDKAHVLAVIPHVTPQVADMLKVLLLTGMRPGEVVAMRAEDINRSKEIWIYEPPDHKNQWRGDKRQIPLGPKAQEIITPYLTKGKADAHLFSPAEADKERSKKRRANRKSPLTPSQKARKAKANGKRRPRENYTTSTLRKAVEYGIKAANKALPKDAAAIPDWNPNQIRHTKATEIRKIYGLDGSQHVLGHKHANVTEIYAEKNLDLASQIAKETG